MILGEKSVKYCHCPNPTGFNFVRYEGNTQVWRHCTCDGLVVRALIRTGSLPNYDNVMNVEPGMRVAACAHFKTYGTFKLNRPKVSYVQLREIPGTIGYHGTCETCGTRYVSQPQD